MAMKKTFSQREGLSQPKTCLQVDCMDDDLRNSLWNALLGLVGSRKYANWSGLAANVARDFLKVPIDDLSSYTEENYKWLRARFYSFSWYEVYDLIEFIVQGYPRVIHPSFEAPKESGPIDGLFNRMLERELSGFRFISGVLTPISNRAEVGEMAHAIESSDRHGLEGVHQHLVAAIGLLGKRPEPDHRNAIKEAISAVESVSKLIAGVQSGGLQEALKSLAERTSIHGARSRAS